MSTATKGGASLRLVTGLTLAGLAVCGVIAANIHIRVPASCTLSGRNTSSGGGVIMKDVLKLSCTGLTANTVYRIATTTSSTAGIDTSGSNRGAGTGLSVNSAVSLDNTDGSSKKYEELNSGNNGGDVDWFILTADPSTSSVSMNLEVQPSGGGSAIATPSSAVTIYQVTASWNANPISGSTTDARLDLTGLGAASLAGEKYDLVVTSGLSGVNSSGQANDGTSSNPLRFNGSGVRQTYTSPTFDIPATFYLDAISPASQQTFAFNLKDNFGNVLFTSPGGNLTVNP